MNDTTPSAYMQIGLSKKGNPHYFIYKWIRSWDNWELAEQMQELMGEEFEIVEEE